MAGLASQLSVAVIVGFTGTSLAQVTLEFGADPLSVGAMVSFT